MTAYFNCYYPQIIIFQTYNLWNIVNVKVMAESEVKRAEESTINDAVVSNTINYYGHGLLKQLADTSRHLLPPEALKDINYHSFKERATKLQLVNIILSHT